MYANVHLPNDCLLPGILLFWSWTLYEQRLASYGRKTAFYIYLSKNALRACLSTSGASVQLFWAYHVQSGHTRTSALVELWKQKFNYSFFCLLGLEDQISATEDAVVHLDPVHTPLLNRLPTDLKIKFVYSGLCERYLSDSTPLQTSKKSLYINHLLRWFKTDQKPHQKVLSLP